MKVLGIDVGTGGTRAVLVDEMGRVVASATSEHAPMSSPQIGWAEQEPRDWWRAACESIQACLARAQVRPTDIAGVGLAGQMHSLVLLDSEDEVLRPAILWCDQRTEAQCHAITEKIGAKRLIELTANPALTNFTLPKLWWVREQEPDIWRRARGFLLPKDYVRFCLTGAKAIDVADASGTLLLDVAKRRWSDVMVESSQLDPSWLPRLFESQEVVGGVSPEGSRATGLLVGTPVVAGAGDQAAGAVGMGIVHAGSVSAVIGTSGVVFVTTDAPRLDPQGRLHTFCHAIPGCWHVMGVTQAAGLSLRWFRDQFGARENGKVTSYERLMEEAADAPPGCEGLLWTPYLMGERTPHLDPKARGVLYGITAQHTRSHIVRAILEGVAFSLRDTLTILKELSLPVTSIRLGGGGARAPLWRQIQADVYGMPVEVPATEEGAAFGAALLAGVGAGVWTCVAQACDVAVRVSTIVQPHPERAALMDQSYVAYRKLYPALREIGAETQFFGEGIMESKSIPAALKAR